MSIKDTLLSTAPLVTSKEVDSRIFTRREFLDVLLKFLFLLIFGGKDIDILQRKPLQTREFELSAEINSAIYQIRNKHGLELYTNISYINQCFGIGGEVAKISEQEPILLIIEECLSKYPPSFFRKNKIFGITLVKNLTKGLHPVLSLASYYSFRSGEIFINTAYGYDPEAIRHAIDHEVYHIADLRTWGLNSGADTDKGWTKLHNCEHCRVYTHGDGESDIASAVFAYPYGSSSPAEDRATIADTILSSESYPLFLSRLASLPESERLILAEKMRRVKKNYSDWSGGVMGDQYWLDLLSGQVGVNYFS